jgi:carbamoyl-phosphate synthase large subunit
MKASILVTRGDGVGFPGYAKAIKRSKDLDIKLIATSDKKNIAGVSFVDEMHIVPEVTDENYIHSLLEICERENIDVLMPVDPRELSPISKSKEKFLNIGTKPMVCEPEVLEMSENKHTLYKICKSLSVPIPKYYPVKTFDEFEKAIKDLGYPNTKLCFKPSVSSGSRGFRDILPQKIDRISEFFTGQSDQSISIEEFYMLVGDNEFPELLVMEYLPGDEYSVDVLADGGQSLVIVPRIREETLIGASFTGKTVQNQEIIGYARLVTERFKLDHIVGMQFKLDSEGIPRITEINPRPHGGLIITILSGANLLELGIKKMLGIKIEEPQINWGTRTFRYVDDFAERVK